MNNLQEIKEIATYFFKSGLFKELKNIEQAVTIIIAGSEIGVKPFQSIKNIDIIQGQLSVKPLLLASKIKDSEKYDYTILESNNEICSIEFFEFIDNKRISIGAFSFSIKDAQRAKLAGRNTWLQYPREMLYNRAMAMGARKYCPDLFFVAVYDRDELLFDTNDNGEVLESIKKNVTKTVPKTKEKTDEVLESIKKNVTKTVPNEIEAPATELSEDDKLLLSYKENIEFCEDIETFNNIVSSVRKFKKPIRDVLAQEVYKKAGELQVELNSKTKLYEKAEVQNEN